MRFFALFACCALWANPTKQIQLGESALEVEISDTEETLRQGLMFRAALPEGKGMLFIHKKAQILSYWMKNTSIPLSIAFFDENRILLNIEDMPPCQKDPSLRSFKSTSPAQYALEVPQGWFERRNIKPGMKFSFRDP